MRHLVKISLHIKKTLFEIKNKKIFFIFLINFYYFIGINIFSKNTKFLIIIIENNGLRSLVNKNFSRAKINMVIDD